MWYASVQKGIQEPTEHNIRRLDYTTVLFTVLVGIVSYTMMSISSTMQNAFVLLWLPAALQMIADIWLGPLRGTIAATGVEIYEDALNLCTLVPIKPHRLASI